LLLSFQPVAVTTTQHKNASWSKKTYETFGSTQTLDAQQTWWYLGT